MSTLDDFREKLRNVKPTSNGFRASCPVPGHGQGRGDLKPSLHVSEGQDGRVLLYCQAGCSNEEIVAAVGLEMRDLFKRNGHSKNGARKSTASWEIKDEEGEVQAIHVRVDHENGDKDCFWKLPEQKEWGLKGRRLDTLPLYRSEMVKKRPLDVPVIVVEGEKAADALSVVYPDVVGTATGASETPGPEPLTVLRDRLVVLWPDNDDPGRAHMQRVAQRLEDIAKEVRIYEPEGIPDKGDAADHPAVHSNDPATLLSEWAKAPKVEAEPEPENNGHVGRSTPSFNCSDQGNAERLVHRHGENLHYIYPRGKWLVYDGKRWRMDDTGEVERLAKETVRAMFHEGDPGNGAPIDKELVKHALSSQSATRIGNMIALARSEPGIPVRPDELDAHPWLLNCQNGTIDLRTGELREHRREDLITKLVPLDYDSDAGAPRFERFLREVLVDDELIAFVRRFAGYSLTGSTRERVIAILHGRGKNGKSTLVELFHDVLGDYATTTSTETLLTKRYEGVGNDVAALKGARFVAAAEVEKGRRLAESKVKQLTGNDTVTARFLYGEPFSFRPEFKLWLSTNNRPEIHGTDDAIWDRIRLIPFTQRFEGAEADHELPDKLRDEMPGVLAWMVRGCSEWLLDGLGETEKVKAATEDYRSEMDVLGAFIADRCVLHADAWTLATPLYKEYERWCEENGEQRLTQTKFGRNLSERGFEQKRQSGSRLWMRRGIGLLDPRDSSDTGIPLGAEREERV